jgi:hypothetical protein
MTISDDRVHFGGGGGDLPVASLGGGMKTS